MIAAAFAVGIGLLTWFFSGVEDRAINPNQDPSYNRVSDGVVEVYLERNRSGHYVLSGFINNIAADFILDTGATDVVVPSALASAAGLEAGYSNQAMTANGVVRVYATRIKNLQLGPITLNDVSASINPAMSDNMVLLGMSALKHIEFSQRGNLLTLRYIPD